MTDEIPWDEAATVVQYRSSSEPTVVDVMVLYQGSLRDVVSKMRDARPKQLGQVRISLPDRGVRPFHFDGYALKALLERDPPAK